jgi:TctA family transporter
METLSNLAFGLTVALGWQNIVYCFIGCFLGTLVGVLPGIGPVATVAMLLPFTFGLGPAPALIMLAGIYYGAQYGGSTSAILVNLPGESSAVVTCLDGHQMAKQGRAGPALAIAALGSFFAGTVATLILATLAPPLAEVAFAFGPADYFSLMVLGLIAAVVLAHGSVIKAIAMILLGLLLGQVGTDVTSGIPRYSFDLPELADGIDFAVVAMGMFGFGEIIANLDRHAQEGRVVVTKEVHGLWPSKEDFKQIWAPVLRGTALGSALGILPGGGAVLSSFGSYTIEKKLAKDPSRFGKGAPQGLAGPESANNAAAQTSFIPLLTLYSAERGDGADGGGDDHSRHHPRPQRDDRAPGAVLGHDRQHVGGEPAAGGAQSPAHRHLDSATDGALPAALSGDPGVLLHRRLQLEE